MENRIEGMPGMDIRMLKHDMRAPIANVIALAQMSMRALAGGGAQESVLPYLNKILVAAQELKQLTGEMAGGGEEEEQFTALDVARTLSATIGAQAAQKNQLLHIDVSGLGGGGLTGERTTLMRVLTNLLINAVKYTQEGGRISLTARGERNGRGGMDAEFIVEDNGMGMDAAFMERMFEPLSRSRQAIESGIEGFGLGLASVKRLAQRLNGTIHAQSEPGKGTRFVLRAPLGMKEAAQERSLAGKRFLLAEDNDLSAEIAQAILEGRGAGVRRAADGMQAVNIFREEPAGAFDAILLDMRMPAMGGCAAAEAIRHMARADAKGIPILALTAGEDAQDEREAIAAGMNACLRKPLDVERLCEAMGDV